MNAGNNNNGTIVVVDASPDTSITKTERFDVDFARQLIEDKNIGRVDRDKLKKYFKNRIAGNQHETTYKLGRHLKHEFLGRFCALRGEGLQTMPRDIRSALAKDYYWDLDFVNAQPTILAQYATTKGWRCEAIKKYVENREDYLTEICGSLQCERWFAKEKPIRLVFGAGVHELEGMPAFFADEFYPELRNIMRNNWDQNKAQLKWLEKQPNHVGKALADMLQTEERKCLLALDRALARRGRSLDVLLHDGGFVLKKDAEEEFPEEVLREAERDIERETGYKVRLEVKEMKTSFVKADAGDDYAAKKVAWEETGWKDGTYFKLRNPASFMGVFKDSVRQFSRTDLLQNEEDNKLSDGSLFLKRWLEDPEKAEFNDVVFLPSGECAPTSFNLFQGLPCQPAEGDYAIYQTLLNILVNHDAACFDYVENWLAHAVQKPEQKTGVCLIFKGKKGIGKDTFWDAIGYNIFGKYYTATSKPEHDLFGRFGGATANKLLVKIEEGNFATNKENEERFKGLVTCKKDNFEQKGKDPIEVDSYANYVTTTNQDVPVVLSSDERRFVMFDGSEEKKGDHVFWTETYAQLEKPEVHRAYLDYLMKKDITNFKPSANLIRTQAFMDALQSFIPYHARWFQTHIEVNEEGEDMEFDWRARELYGAMRTAPSTRFEVTEPKWAAHIRDYVKAGALTKIRGGGGHHYTCKRDALKAFLVARSWWVEL
jgi:hypothetical protein